MLRILTVCFLAFIPLVTLAQMEPPAPEPTRKTSNWIVEGPVNWAKMPGIQDDFNRKDAAMALIRTTGIGKSFSEETNEDFVNDFHFLDLKGDRGSEGIYSGKTKAAGWHSYIFVGSPDFKYHLGFDAAGYIHSLTRKGLDWNIVMRQDPGEREFFSVVTRHYWISALEKDSLISELRFAGITTLPEAYFEQEKVLRMGKSDWIRYSPAFQDDPVVDYNQDGRPDLVGNRIVAFREGHEAIQIAEVERKGLKWALVVCPVKDPAPGHALGKFTPGITYVAGWIRSEYLAE